MANRHSLILDTVTSIVRELPNSDVLDLSSTPIFDGYSVGTPNEVLRSIVYDGEAGFAPAGSPGILWQRYPDAFLTDVQTFEYKTLKNATININSNTFTNIANNMLVNDNINFTITTGGTVSTKSTSTQSITLGSTLSFSDLNDDTTYTLSTSRTNITSGADTGVSKANINLTAGGSGSGTNTISISTGPNYLTFTEPTANNFVLTFAMETLTAGNYFIKINTPPVNRTYNGLTAQTFTVDASAANDVGKVLARNNIGNFSANTIYANLSGTATRVSGRLNFDDSNSTIIGYNPSNSASIYAYSDGSTNTTINFNGSVGTSVNYGVGKLAARDSNGDFWARDIGVVNLTASDTILGNIIRIPDGIGGYKSGFLKGDGSIDTKSYIPVTTTSNARGTRYVQTTEPFSPVNGDIWYEIL